MLIPTIVLFSSIFISASASAEDEQYPLLLKNHTGPDVIITEKFTEYVERVLHEEQVRGLALGIIRPDGEIELGAWGTSSEEGRLVTADTLFAIGSCSKAFLSTSLGILMDDFSNARNISALPSPLSEFGWKTKIKDLIPDDWVLQDKWIEEKADLRDILCHVSGMAGHDFSYKAQDSPRSIVRRLRYHNSPLELRQTWAYNNEMFITGSYILEKYSGMTFPEFAQKRIFSPLGMNSTVMSVEIANTSGNFSQSWSSKGRRIPFWFTGKNVEAIAGAGGIISNTRDLMKWVNVLLHKGIDPISGSTIIPESTFEAVTTASAIVIGQGIADIQSIVGYSLGWMLDSIYEYNILTHSGGLPGFQSLVQFFPNSNLGLVSLTNTDTGFRVNSRVSMSVMAAVLDTGYTDPAMPSDNNVSILMGENVVAPENSSAGNPYGQLPLPHIAYSGTYYAPDYGNFTLCTYPMVSINHIPYCEELRSSFSLIDEVENKTADKPQLISTSQSFWFSNLRLTHLSNDTFTIEALSIFENGYGADKRPFAYTFGSPDTQTARFIYTDESTPDHKGRKRTRSHVTGFFACGLMRDVDAGIYGCAEDGYPTASSLVWFEKIDD